MGDVFQDTENAARKATTETLNRLDKPFQMAEASGDITHVRGMGNEQVTKASTGLDKLVSQDTKNSIGRNAADKLLKGLKSLATSGASKEDMYTYKATVEGKLGTQIDIDDLQSPNGYETIISSIDQDTLTSLYNLSQKDGVGSGLSGTSDISRTLDAMAKAASPSNEADAGQAFAAK